MRSDTKPESPLSIAYTISFLCVGLLLGAATLVPTSANAARFEDDPSVTVQMMNKQGKSVGTVKVVQLAQGVLFVTHLKNLPPGGHAFHIHSKAACTPPKFQSAGGHYSPAGGKHGLDNPEGFHAGDLPNIHVTTDGTAVTEIFVRRFTLRQPEASGNEGADAGLKGRPFPLLDGNGSAIILHKKADDYEAVPPGSTGPRIGCGEIRPQ